MIDGLKFTVTGVELKQIYARQIERLSKALQVQEAAKESADEVAQEIGYDTAITGRNTKAAAVKNIQHELKQTRWKRDHINEEETYLISNQDYSFPFSAV